MPYSLMVSIGFVIAIRSGSLKDCSSSGA